MDHSGTNPPADTIFTTQKISVSRPISLHRLSLKAISSTNDRMNDKKQTAATIITRLGKLRTPLLCRGENLSA